MAAPRFDHFAAIDWSGARGTAHRGIAVAICGTGDAPPVLVAPPDRRWSRTAVRDWLITALPADAIVGFDLGPALPHADCGAYFPGWEASPADAHGLWALVEALCVGEPDLAATGFADHPAAQQHFRRHGGRTGQMFGTGRGRLRVTEHAQRAQGLNPYSNLNLVGAAQVGKSSLSGMRLFHALQGRLPIWPFDPLPPAGPVLLEIYTSLAARDAGRPPGRSKMRSVAELNAALAALGSRTVPGEGAIDDHASDALLTAAWLRAHAGRPALWQPAGLTEAIARTEGWTFGVV
ncbi:hypothetical protein [Sphingomonas sp.]|uniref:hypothetical protein n=1 Tax=Sphingomonas sp. TaxID=28214 RepID=UPI001D90A37F|nr:hypothetical protein [Sphingomonas sp.]MBX9796460.1 hypothetical protein [Sphingomonas sp.]